MHSSAGRSGVTSLPTIPKRTVSMRSSFSKVHENGARSSNHYLRTKNWKPNENVYENLLSPKNDYENKPNSEQKKPFQNVSADVVALFIVTLPPSLSATVADGARSTKDDEDMANHAVSKQKKRGKPHFFKIEMYCGE